MNIALATATYPEARVTMQSESISKAAAKSRSVSDRVNTTEGAAPTSETS